MHPIYGSNTDNIGIMIASYFTKNTGYPVTGPFTAMGWIKDNKIVAQAIFNDYTGANIELHFYGPGHGTRRVIRDVCNYVFNQINCARLTVKPYCINEKLLQIVKKVGFVQECIQKDYYCLDGKLLDASVFKLTKEDAFKWLHKEMKIHERI